MKRIIFLGVLMILTVLVSPTLVFSNPAGPPEGIDVKVINDATEPVPVTGEVTATVSGDVNVINAIEPVKSVDDVINNVNCPGGQVIYTVPDDKLLIIEDASGIAVDNANTQAIIANASVKLSLLTISGGVPGLHRIVVSNEIPLGGGRTMRVYADPGTEVAFRVEGCENPVNSRVNFSGQLISLE